MSSSLQKSQFALDQKKTAESIIRSLQLLGFSTDNYPVLGTNQLTYRCFDNTNEKWLLCLLHFLLCKLDLGFLETASACWPFYEAKEKNEFKRIAHLRMSKVVDLGGAPILSSSDSRASLLTVAKGGAIWTILRKLSDAAIDRALVTISPSSAGVGDPLLSDETPSVEELMKAIRVEHDCILSETRETLLRQQSYARYAAELEQRLQTATAATKQSKADMAALSQTSDALLLSETARLDRSEMVLRIKAAQDELQQFLESPLPAASVKVRDFYTPSPYSSSSSSSTASKSNKVAATPNSRKSHESSKYRIATLEDLDTLVLFLEDYSSITRPGTGTSTGTGTMVKGGGELGSLSTRALLKLVDQAEQQANVLVHAREQSSRLLRDSSLRVARP